MKKYLLILTGTLIISTSVHAAKTGDTLFVNITSSALNNMSDQDVGLTAAASESYNTHEIFLRTNKLPLKELAKSYTLGFEDKGDYQQELHVALVYLEKHTFSKDVWKRKWCGSGIIPFSQKDDATVTIDYDINKKAFSCTLAKK